MFLREKLSISEIQRRTSLSRNTVRKWLKAEVAGEPKYERRGMVTKLKPFEEQLRRSLEADALRPKRDRRTALALFAELQLAGFPGSHPRVCDFVRRWREEGALESVRSAFVPLRFELGEAFQFDWSEEPLFVGGIQRRLQVAHIKLCASRAFLLVAYPTQRHEMLFDAHTRGFRVFGGVPRRGIYDNMKTVVDKVLKGKGRVVNNRFTALAAHYLFDPEFCNVASGWEKGVVEKDVQDNRRRIWQEALSRQFGSLAELNQWLEARCIELWSELPCPGSSGLTVADVLEMERAELMPMPSAFDGYVEVLARVSLTCLVVLERNRYSVPCRLANRRVSLRLYPGRLEVYADETRVATHERLFDRDQVRYDWQHYIPLVERKPGALRNGAPFAEMPTPLRMLQGALLRRPGGDRLMAEVLACVPTFGLEAVVAAAERVLESGNASVEHVRNVLTRLNEPPVPEPLETALRVREAPLADTARYDRLHRTEAGHAE
jgi:transposase